MGFMTDSGNGGVDPRKQLLEGAKTLSEELVGFCSGEDAQTAMLAAELLIAFRAVQSGMTLQEMMDNLLQNMPNMYVMATEAKLEVAEQEPLIKG